MNLEQLVGKIERDLLLDPSVKLVADTELLMSGLLDSLGVVSLVAWLEDETAVTIDPGNIVMERFETPSAILALVSGLVSADQSDAAASSSS